MPKLQNFGSHIRPLNTARLQAYPKRAMPIYQSPEWRELMREITAERGRVCQDPQHDPLAPRKSGVIYGDHIVELIDGGAPLDKSNILLRCAPCHGRKTVEQRKIRAGIT